MKPEHARPENRKLKEKEFWMVGNDDTVEALKSLENINKILGKNVPYNPPIDFTKTFLNNIIIIGLALGAFLMRNFVL